MGTFTMPSLGADMDVGTVLEWRVAPGDTVHKGDIVAVVDTEKATIEVEIFEDGVIDEILVQPGEEVPVGTPLARLTPAPVVVLEPGAPAVAPPPAPEPTVPEPVPEPLVTEPPPPEPEAAEPAVVQPALVEPAAVEPAAVEPLAAGPVVAEPVVAEATTGAATHVRASPLARRRAVERGIDLAQVDGTGPGGAVLVADVEHAGPTAPMAPAAATEPASTAAETPRAVAPKVGRQDAMRRAIATLMARSKREIPHYYLATTIDFGPARDWLTEANADRPVATRLLPGALLLKATALAAREVPDLNGFWEDGGFRPSPAVHLGVAVSLRGGGLLAPAIHDADRLGLDELMSALRDLVMRARAGRLLGTEMVDPTITVTNLGDQGVEEVHGVIYPPQVALVGFGKVVDRPWAVDGLLGVRPVVRATLAADHRATDGHVGARFLAAIDHLLQSPEDL